MADVSFSSAAAAYGQGLHKAAEIAKVGGASAATEQSAGGFADLMTNALESARDAGQTAEADSLRALKGDVGLHEVVTSVTSAEVTLQTVVAVRDKVISAYNDIIRMPI